MPRRETILEEGREAADTTPKLDGRGSLTTIQEMYSSVSDLAAMSLLGGVPIAIDKFCCR